MTGQLAAVRVRSADPVRLASALTRGHNASVRDGEVLVSGTDPEHVGAIALRQGVAILGMDTNGGNLGDVFLRLTRKKAA